MMIDSLIGSFEDSESKIYIDNLHCFNNYLYLQGITRQLL